MIEALVIAAPACALLTGAATWLARTPRQADLLNSAGAVLTAALTLILAGIAVADAAHPHHGTWWVLDAAGGVFLAVVAVVGLLSALVAPSHLATSGRGLVRAARGRAMYYVAYHAFWAALIAVPLVDNLGLAWLLVEATTGASALLVAYSGTRGALEAGWKYLVLTTFGLAIAMLGIIVLYVAIAPGDGTLATLDWQSIARAAPGLQGGPAVVAFVLIVAGLATKVGWAPVHNWLPDAHSEAPPPVSALLSAALLPTVVLVTWRVVVALGPALTAGTASALLLAFGLVSLAVAVPFLWRSMAWKRLLAYSSLEHMGILAVGIGFATPLATAGVVVHVAGHALAKSLGFYAAGPLLRHAPRAHERAVRGLAFANPLDGRRGRRQPRSAVRDAAVAAVRQRAADPPRRDRGRRDRRDGRRSDAARARVPGTRARTGRRAGGGTPGEALALTPLGTPAAAADRRLRHADARADRRRLSAAGLVDDRPSDGRDRVTAAPAIEHVDASRWRSTVSAAVERGAEFDCLYAAHTEHGPAVRLALRQGSARTAAQHARRRIRGSRRSSICCPPPSGTSARPATPTACSSTGTSRCARSSRTRRTVTPGSPRSQGPTSTRSRSGRSMRE